MLIHAAQHHSVPRAWMSKDDGIARNQPASVVPLSTCAWMNRRWWIGWSACWRHSHARVDGPRITSLPPVYIESFHVPT